MKVNIAFDVEKTRQISWQEDFPITTPCCKCGFSARLGFVAHEGGIVGNRKEEKDEGYICDVHETTGEKGGLWLHDCCCVAVYFCADCLEATALYNQA